MHKTVVTSVWVGGVLILAFLAVAVGLRRSDVSSYDRSYVWSVDHDEGSGRGLLVRGRKVKAISRDVNKLVIAFNKTFAESEPAANPEGERVRPELPRLRLQKLESSTATVEIANSEYLAERMGSSGSQDYLAAATFTLTECPQVKTVSFVFPGGEHAVPGEYARANFPDYQVVPDGN